MSENEKISDLILENNHQFIVAVKPGGMPVQKDKTGDNSFHQILEQYCKCNLHLHTRLDRPVSGLVLLSKKETSRKHFTKLREERKWTKKYYAIVEGKVEKDDQLLHYIIKDSKRNCAIISEAEEKNYKKVELSYKLIKTLDNYSILELNLPSGRFHQIRAQLGHIGHAIKGDVKYGARRGNKDRTIHLHAGYLQFTHPTNFQNLEFIAKPNQEDSLWKELPNVNA